MKKKLTFCTLLVALSVTCFSCGKSGGETDKNAISFYYKIRKPNQDYVSEKEYILSNESKFSFTFSDFVNKKTDELNKSILSLNTLLVDDMLGDGPDGGVYIKHGDEFTHEHPGKNLLNYFECEDITTYDLSKNEYEEDKYDLQVFEIAHKTIAVNSKSYQIFFIVMHGTNGNNDVINDLDIGFNNENYVNENTPHTAWKNKNNHKGFDVAANRSFEVMTDYIDENKKDGCEVIINLNGHSKGGSVANIVGTLFADSTTYKTFTYTYAAPCMTTVKESNYNSIFNIVNEDDAIANLFTADQGFYRYGQTISKSANEYKEEIDEYYNNEYLYECPPIEPIQKLLKELYTNREDIYIFKDSRKGEKTFDSLEDAEEEKASAEKLADTLKKEYSVCLKISEVKQNQDTKEYYYEFSYTPSIMLNLVMSFLRGDAVRIGIPLAAYCGSYVAICLPYVFDILGNGVFCFMKAHLLAGYKAITDNI